MARRYLFGPGGVSALAAAFAVALLGPSIADAAEIELWTARAIATVLAEIGPEFERASGHKLKVHVGLPADFEARADAGEPFDLVVSTSSTVDRWIDQGRLVPATRVDIARSGIGVAIRAGAPKPDIRSVEGFKRALLEAKSIAYLNVGSGIHVHAVIERLGIAAEIEPKVTRPQTDVVSELVANGEIELGMVVITQILTTPGVELVGPLPPELQSHVVFTGAAGTGTRAPDAGRQLLDFLAGATAAPVIRVQGMEPMGMEAKGEL